MVKRRERESCPLCGTALSSDLHGESCRNCGYTRTHLTRGKRNESRPKSYRLGERKAARP